MAYLVGSDGQIFELTTSSATIGRGATNDVSLQHDRRVSRHHAELRRDAGQWVVTDLVSRNGVFVNGQRVETQPLLSGDELAVGDTVLVFREPDDPEATEAGFDRHPAGEPDLPLSKRERDVITLVANGRTDRQIADELHISISTVRSHLDRVGERTGHRRRSDLTRLAMQLGLVQ
jgi:pSer/pThr/pTyr-binding forkhead associated (FHA) protein